MSVLSGRDNANIKCSTINKRFPALTSLDNGIKQKYGTKESKSMRSELKLTIFTLIKTNLKSFYQKLDFPNQLVSVQKEGDLNDLDT
jgi:hypothetical protein